MKAIYRKFGDVRIGQFFIHGGILFYKNDKIYAKFAYESGYYDFDPIVSVIALELK